MKLPRTLTHVTWFSKIIAFVLFFTFPLVAFLLGLKYQQMVDLYERQTKDIGNEISRYPTPSLPQVDYILDNSEGLCTKDTQCFWAGQGCGGGHGICTDTPDRYIGTISTCEFNPNFPSNKGYKCKCVAFLGKCGWVK